MKSIFVSFLIQPPLQLSHSLSHSLCLPSSFIAPTFSTLDGRIKSCRNLTSFLAASPAPPPRKRYALRGCKKLHLTFEIFGYIFLIFIVSFSLGLSHLFYSGLLKYTIK